MSPCWWTIPIVEAEARCQVRVHVTANEDWPDPDGKWLILQTPERYDTVERCSTKHCTAPISKTMYRPRLALLALGLSAATLAAEPYGDWRVIRSQPAPWLADGAAAPAHLAPGDRVQLTPTGIDGPGGLHCGAGQGTALKAPAEGLFQGGLSQAAAQAAELGFGAGPHPTLRIDCDHGSWDFHAADPDTLLFAYDQRLYTLSRSHGTRAANGSPAAQVQALLEAHYAGGLAFTREGTQALRAYLSDDLHRDITEYLAVTWPADEVPPLNGDPYTNSPETPTRFHVRDTVIDGDRARVTVHFADAYREQRVEYQLRRIVGHWLLRDIAWDSVRFAEVLRQRP